VEGPYVYGKWAAPQALNKLGPDLCYMAAILILFDIIDPGSAVQRFAAESAISNNNPDLEKVLPIVFGLAYVVLWFICASLYKEFGVERLSTNSELGNLSFSESTLRNHCGKWATTLVIATFLFIFAINGQ